MQTISVEFAPASFGTVVTQLAFQNRFPAGSLVTIDIAGIDPGSQATQQARQFAATVRTEKQRMFSAEYVNLALPGILQSLMSFESAGLIPAGSALEILKLPVGSAEIPSAVRQQFGLPYVVRDDEYAKNDGRGYYIPTDAGL